jgi:hypothetical protein
MTVSTNLTVPRRAQLAPHPFGYKTKILPQTQHTRHPAKKDTHLDPLSKLTNEQRRPLSRPRSLLALIPRITHPDREPRPVRRKRERSDGRLVARELTQPFFDLVVPDRDRRVRAARCERVVRRVERERVDGPYVVDVVDRLSVALERVLFFLDRWRGIEVLYGDASFDRRGRVPWEGKEGAVCR